MALIVEDGTGKSDAESLASVAEADAYHTSRGNLPWINDPDMTEAAKEQALRRASDYIMQVYRLRWDGTRTSSSQALDWPRAFVIRKDFEYSGLNGYTVIGGNYYYPSNSVPVEVKNACIELAFKAAAGELAADLEQGIVREKVDVLEVEYDKYSPQQKRYRAIDMLLAPFLKVNGSSVNKVVVRV